jgi:hypothetical protein
VYYTNYSKYFAQLLDCFIPFDECFDEFQLECDQSTSVMSFEKLNKIDISEQNNLAIAARFLDDNLWYRARILDMSTESNQLNIQFVDYGNQQLTKIEDCIFLSRRFAHEFYPSAVPCSQVVHIHLNEIVNDKFMENVLFYAKYTSEEQSADEVKMNWTAYFSKSFDNNNR